MSNEDVSHLAQELARAVELTMSATASQTARHEAYTACERFKETSPLCAQAGLFLAGNAQSSTVVRHFGLQLMEHTVKYRWNHISQPEKLFIKENAMKLLAAGGVGNEPHMKDALSRVVVEMVKREWPQQWPSLLPELSEACSCGEVQTELVLMIFLRLVEDVALLQTLESNQRRKDIYQALTTNMAVIFEFFLQLIELHVSQFREHSLTGNTEKAAAHGRVVQVVLLTLTGFVEWVSMTHIMIREGRLLHILCLLLTDSAFQCSAAECLLQIVNRKGRTEERKPLLILFSDEAANCLLAAAKMETPTLSEPQYLFKKKVIHVLAGLGSQLCALWGKDFSLLGRPNNFSVFLDAILAFSSHPSLTLAHLANPLWNSMLKHELISKDPVFLSYIPQWVQCTAPKIMKVNYPITSVPCSPPDTASYCKLDYDSEEEFALFFYRCRTDFLDTFRQATIVAPLITFGYVEQWLTKCLQIPDTMYGLTSQDPLYLEWEALANVTESVLSRVLQATERPSISAGLCLIELCLVYDPYDPLILSTLLTCMSALFVFFSMSLGNMMGPLNADSVAGACLLSQVLKKIFSVLTFSLPEQTKDTRSKAVKNVRRHAASLMVKIGHKYPLLLLPVFDQMRQTVSSLERQTGSSQMSMLERVTLQEALLLISNHFCDYDRQTKFVAEVIVEAKRYWNYIASSGAIKDVIQFMAFTGLDKPPGTNDACGQNRSHIVLCVNLLLGIVKRCAWPEDPEKAGRGGFVVGLTESGNPVCRNPATPHVIPILSHLLDLMRIFNELYSPEAQARLSKGFSGVLNMSLLERTNLLGLVGTSVNTDPMESPSAQNSCERMQRFLMYLHESSYHMLGAAGPSLGRDLYQLPLLGNAIVDSVLSSLHVIPDYRLRPVIRVFLKPFIYSCPPAFYESVLLPVMSHLAPFMVNRLTTKWQQVCELRESGALDENADTQEVIDDVLTRALTREYLDVLKIALIGGSLPDSQESEELSMDAPPPPSRNNLATEVISELGTLLLRNERTCQPLLLTVLGALSWIDSNASFKATLLTGSIVRLLVADRSLTGGMAGHIMISVLQALTLHGQHDSNQGSLLTLGAQLYELLRPQFPDVVHVMQQIPNVNPVDLHKLDERISTGCSKGNKVEKVKKDLFKKIIGPLIGRSIGQLFRKEVKIADLPRLQLPKKETSPTIIPDLSKIL